MDNLLDRLKEESLRLTRNSFDSAEAGISANLCDEAIDEIEKLKAALEPFTRLGGPNDGVMPAFHDLEDDVVIYANSGQCITAGDVRTARNAFGLLHAPVRSVRGGE